MMNNNIRTGLFIFALMTFAACSNGTENETNGDKEYHSTYVCSMHCEGSGSSKKGKCPVCKMDYVKNDSHGHAEEWVNE